MNDQRPLPRMVAAREVTRCAVVTVRLLARRETHLRSQRVGLRLAFADGTSARVFRETVVDRDPPRDPCLLVVAFRLRFLHGRGHKAFLWECILNTPLFVGFRGFVSKLWLDHDEHDNYRGLYQWNDPVSAERYARSLWRVLDLVCPQDAIRYIVLPGYRRDEVLRDPQLLWFGGGRMVACGRHVMIRSSSSDFPVRLSSGLARIRGFGPSVLRTLYRSVYSFERQLRGNGLRRHAKIEASG